MRQKSCHAETGIRRQHAELHAQRHLTLRVIGKLLKKLLPDFKTHRIGDNDDRPLLCRFQIFLVKIALLRDAEERILLFQRRIPLRQKHGKIFVGIDLFHKIAQRFKFGRIFQPVVRLVKAAILGIQPIIGGNVLLGNLFQLHGAAIARGRNESAGAAQHPIRPARLCAKVQFFAQFADRRDAFPLQSRMDVLFQQAIAQPTDEDAICLGKRFAAEKHFGRNRFKRGRNAQFCRDGSRKRVAAVAIQHAVHQIVQKGDDVPRLVGNKGRPCFWQRRLHRFCRICDEHRDDELFKRGLFVMIPELLSDKLPKRR